MRRFFAAMLAAALLAGFCACSLAENGEAQIVFGGMTYHFTLESIELSDGTLKVAVRGKESAPMAGFAPQTPAACVAVFGDEEITARTVRVEVRNSLPTYTYIFEKAAAPESILLLPNGSKTGSVVIWEEGDAVPVTEGKAEGKGTETQAAEPDPDIPAGIVGEWFGTAVPGANNSAPNASELDLEMVIRADGNGEWTAVRGGTAERFPLKIEMDGDNIFFDLSLPEDNSMGAKSVDGRIRIKNGWLKVSVYVLLKDNHVDGYEVKCTPERGMEPEEETVPEGLVGTWSGSAKNEYDAKDTIELAFRISEDGTGEAVMVRNGTGGKFGLAVDPEKELFTAVFPEDSPFGIDDFTGQYRLLPDGKLKLDIFAFTTKNSLLVYYMECEAGSPD